MADREMPEFDEFETDIMENARSINSLSGQVQKLTDKDVRRVSSVKGEEELVSTTAKVMRKMGKAVETMAMGMKNVTVGSLRYTKQAIGQYSKAIGEDITVDKRNITALALARATPIFGYFASKFMETEVFQKAAQNIKEKMGNAVSFVGAKLKTILSAPFRGLSSLFKKRSKIPAERLGEEPKTGRRGTFVERGGKVHFHPIGRSKMTPMKIPKMQVGGYVEKGGLTRLHPAEVVMPIDKLLDRIDEKIENESDVRMNKMMKGVTIQQMRMMKRYMKTQEQVQTKSFTESYKEQYKTFVAPFNEKMIDAFSDLKTALLGQPNNMMISMRLMWQRFLTKHPVFLGLLRLRTFFLNMVKWPFRIIFKKRGMKFRWLVSKSKNPLIATSETLARFAPASMGHLDNILTVLKDSLIVQKDLTSFFTGKLYGPTILKGRSGWSFARILKDMVMGDVRRFGRWGKKAKRGLFGDVEEVPEEGAQPITMTDRIDMMIDLLRDIANNSSKSAKEETFKGYVKKNGVWQKKGLEVEKKQLHEQKRNRGLFGRMRNSLSFIGIKIKNLAIKIGQVVMKGISKTISFAKETLDTILAFIPGWVKIALAAVLLPTIVSKLGELFKEKVLPKIDTYMSTMASGLGDIIRRAIQGKKTAEEFKIEEKKKIEDITAIGKQMKKEGKSPSEISRYIMGKLKEESVGATMLERYEKEYGKLTGFERLRFQQKAAGTKITKLISGGFIDEEVTMRNLMEEVQKGTMNPDDAGLLFLSSLQKAKKISSRAYTMLTKSGPLSAVAMNYKALIASGQFYNDKGVWVTQDEWFRKRAGFTQKATTKVGQMMDSKSFGIFKLEEQFKEATSREIKAKDLADEMDKKYAEYVKESMTPEAYRILTKGGFTGIGDKLSTMISNNQLVEYDGKLNTSYQFLRKTDKLTWKDRFKYMFGLREVSPGEMITKLGVKSIMTMEHGKEYMKQMMPLNPYSVITEADLKAEIRKGGANAYDYAQELMERLPTDQYSAFMKTVIGTPTFQRSMELAAKGKGKIKSITEIVNPAVKRSFDVLNEKIARPVMQRTQVAATEARSAIAEQKAMLESNKRVQAGVEKTKELYNNLNNSVSSIASSVTNNISNNISNTSPPRRDLITVDPDLRDVTIGDLK